LTNRFHEKNWVKMDLSELCLRLREAASTLEPSDGTLAWPKEQLQWCAEAGVLRWFVPQKYGGWNWSESKQLEGYLAISQACLTTAFVLTQWNAACKRIVQSTNAPLRERWLPGMADGRIFATVGISHLTTSRQHLKAPALLAEPQPRPSSASHAHERVHELADASANNLAHDQQHAQVDARTDYILQGFSPWVTGAPAADLFVVGATQADGRQLLCAVPADRDGLQPSVPNRLVALSASQTGAVHFTSVHVSSDDIIAGPVENVMKSGAGGGAGGLQTSTLAIGLTQAAVEFLLHEASLRSDLTAIAEKLAADALELRRALLASAAGHDSLTAVKLREQANSLVLRATQAALAAAKGAGFAADHPVGRYCREALFFLVWSCPQPVLAANLCEFAQV